MQSVAAAAAAQSIIHTIVVLAEVVEAEKGRTTGMFSPLREQPIQVVAAVVVTATAGPNYTGQVEARGP